MPSVSTAISSRVNVQVSVPLLPPKGTVMLKLWMLSSDVTSNETEGSPSQWPALGPGGRVAVAVGGIGVGVAVGGTGVGVAVGGVGVKVEVGVGEDVGVAVGATGVDVAVGGMGVAVATGASATGVTAGALHLIKNNMTNMTSITGCW